MNISGLIPAGNDRLQAISGGGVSALEAVAVSDDVFPPLKAAVIEALTMIGIVKVCALTSIIVASHVYLCHGIRNSRSISKIGPLFLRVSLKRWRKLFRLPANTTRVKSC